MLFSNTKAKEKHSEDQHAGNVGVLFFSRVINIFMSSSAKTKEKLQRKEFLHTKVSKWHWSTETGQHSWSRKASLSMNLLTHCPRGRKNSAWRCLVFDRFYRWQRSVRQSKSERINAASMAYFAPTAAHEKGGNYSLQLRGQSGTFTGLRVQKWFQQLKFEINYSLSVYRENIFLLTDVTLYNII